MIIFLLLFGTVRSHNHNSESLTFICFNNFCILLFLSVFCGLIFYHLVSVCSSQIFCAISWHCQSKWLFCFFLVAKLISHIVWKNYSQHFSTRLITAEYSDFVFFITFQFCTFPYAWHVQKADLWRTEEY